MPNFNSFGRQILSLSLLWLNYVPLSFLKAVEKREVAEMKDSFVERNPVDNVLKELEVIDNK